MITRRGALAGVAGAGLAALAAPSAPSALAAARGLSTKGLPTTLALPDGFQPEGIGIGAWPVAYFGSRVDGRIFAVDLITGRGTELSAGPGTPSLGIKVDSAHGRLFVAGGSGGDARVIDARGGQVLASYPLAGGFVNDLVLTRDAVWFTDSFRPVLYRLPLGERGRLPSPGDVETVPLSGDITFAPEEVNANGIVTTPDGSALLLGQSNTGTLFRVDPGTGVATAVDLGGESLPNNDGLLREGRSLYVVQNRLNLLAKLALSRDGSRARVVTRRSSDGFDVPATMAAWGRNFYLVNARFTTEPTPETPYTAVAVPRF